VRLEALRAARLPFYRQVAHLILDTSQMSPLQVAERIIAVVTRTEN
jgi:shikimate kinase